MTFTAVSAAVRGASLLATSCLFAFCAACSDKAGVADDAIEAQPSDGQWATYDGSWFTIDYPKSFEIVPSLRSDEGDGFDSVFFKSPDHRAGFYVLSPQWGRIAADLALKPEIETELDRYEQQKGEQRKIVKIIQANDGSYTREVEEFFEQDGAVYWVFEFRYSDDLARQRHEAGYQRFKTSLNQYSD